MEIEWGSKGGQGSLQLDTGAKPAALVTGNVGREATEMSPVSGLDPGRTRWVNLLGGPTGWNAGGREGSGIPRGAEEVGSVSHLWTSVLPTRFRLTERLPVLRRGCGPGPGRGPRELPVPCPPSSLHVSSRDDYVKTSWDRNGDGMGTHVPLRPKRDSV